MCGKVCFGVHGADCWRDNASGHHFKVDRQTSCTVTNVLELTSPHQAWTHGQGGDLALQGLNACLFIRAHSSVHIDQGLLYQIRELVRHFCRVVIVRDVSVQRLSRRQHVERGDTVMQQGFSHRITALRQQPSCEGRLCPCVYHRRLDKSANIEGAPVLVRLINMDPEHTGRENL